MLNLAATQAGRVPDYPPSPRARADPAEPRPYLRARARELKLLGKPELSPAHRLKLSGERGEPGPRLPSNATSKMATTTNQPPRPGLRPHPPSCFPSRDPGQRSAAALRGPYWDTCAVSYRPRPSAEVQVTAAQEAAERGACAVRPGGSARPHHNTGGPSGQAPCK